MTEQTMIERIARALCERECADWDAGDFNATKGGELPEEQREYYMDMARAALEAMQTPTEAMVGEGHGFIWAAFNDNSYIGPNCSQTAVDVWHAMIQAALTTDKQGE